MDGAQGAGEGVVSCWIGLLTFEFCCEGEFYVGNPTCWDQHYTWERCCLPSLKRLNYTYESMDAEKGEAVVTFNHESIQVDDAVLAAADVQTTRRLEAVRANQAEAAGMPVPVPAASPSPQHRGYQCIEQYDNRNYRKWFMSQSGIPTHPLANIGNPQACTGGGHSFWWGLVEVNMGIVQVGDGDAETTSSMRRDLEFGMCFPKSCDYGIVQFLLMPFYLGPYLNKPWGHEPVWIQNEVSKSHLGRQESVAEWATTIKVTPGYMFKNWPYSCGLWQYQPTWLPSEGNLLVMGLVLLPLFMARCWRACCRRRPKAESTEDTAATGGLAEKFDPLPIALGLFAPRNDGSAVLHALKVALQLMVCWQHAYFLVDWAGHEGHLGLSAIAPITHGFAHCLGRVNTSFACLSAHLIVGSVSRLLRGRGAKQSILALAGWTMRRWLAQVAELGVWTWYYLMISPEIPWRPFPEFVQVWYTARLGACLNWPQKPGRLPVWMLSSALVYEPVNALTRWHTASSSACHNMSIFEVLFGLSSIVAAVVSVRHICGFRVFASVAILIAAVSAAYMPFADPFVHGSDAAASADSAGSGDWRWQVLPNSVSRLLPSSLFATLLSAAAEAGLVPRPPPAAANRRRLGWWALAWALVLLTALFDFLLWTQSFVFGNWRITSNTLRACVASWNGIMATSALRPPAVQRLLALLFEAPHVIGLYIMTQLGQDARASEQTLPAWLRAISRLSLSVNIANIFVLHYLSGRYHDNAAEFSQLHLTLYTVMAWLASAVLALIAHCTIVPYVALLTELGGRVCGACLGGGKPGEAEGSEKLLKNGANQGSIANGAAQGAAAGMGVKAVAAPVAADGPRARSAKKRS
eukprot:TRINITY_DN38007_c0_g1_i1.p1 TRINITY_DN38007_c0_g1~~TRINITY_DN38007_c0_g1_i1.p1  ORF type:complete len:863 (-),score=126.69 TRINITY_DN38007_c0_g1_i1:49-2637(-)